MSEKKQLSILTKKDILILKRLFEDGRKSSANISKEIDLGREIVNYRIKRLIKENLIVKFIPKINDKAINYKEYIILLKLNLDDDISKETFIKNSIGNKYLVWILKSNSGWDLIVRLYAQNIDEFKKKLEEILEGYSDILAKYYTIITSNEIKQSEKDVLCNSLFDENIPVRDFSVIKKEIMCNIDKKDKEILEYLQTDGRIKYKEIAEKLDISSDTVKYRIDKMKTSGVIENFVPVINYNKLGFIQYAGILKFFYLDKEEKETVYKIIRESQSIIKAIKSLNSEEFFLTLIFDNEQDILQFETSFKLKFADKIDKLELFKID